MKAAFLTSSLIAPKGKASPTSSATAPMKLLDEETTKRSSGVSRIYDRVAEYADHHDDDDDKPQSATTDGDISGGQHGMPFEAAIGPDHQDQTVTASASTAMERPLFLNEESSSEDEIEVFALTEISDAEDVETVKDTPSPIRQENTITDTSPKAGKTRFSVTETVSRALSRPKPTEQLPEAQYEKIAGEVSKLKKDKLGRIRISVRMAPKDHLQLKLIAAHTQMSAQAIFETALEEYVANHGSEILPESCNCVLDKSSL